MERLGLLEGVHNNKRPFRNPKEYSYAAGQISSPPRIQTIFGGFEKKGVLYRHSKPQREKDFPPTVRWLRQNGLLFDEIHLSNDKSVLFPESWAIIDDSPITLDKAARTGIIRAGLLNPWNENSGHPLFNNLLEVLGYIDSLDGRSKP